MSVLVKLCGIADVDSLAAVSEARPDAVGFVVAPSVRQVTLDVLEELLSRIPDGVQRWAVFRDVSSDVVRALAGLPLTGVQGHAGWDGDHLPAAWSFLPVYLDDPSLLDRLDSDGFRGRPMAVDGLRGAFLLDGPRGGGAGVAADRARAARAARLGPMVLAGGLTPGTVAEAVAAVRPLAVDVSSGIESAPAHKDIERCVAFASAARGALSTP